MKKRSNKGKHHFKATTNRSQTKQQVINMKSEDLAVYAHLAEKEVLPIIKNMELIWLMHFVRARVLFA